MEEGRRHKRFEIDEAVHGNMLFASEVRIIDISLGGLCIEVNRRLNIGREYTVKVEDNGKAIILKGTVMWSVISDMKKSSDEEITPMYKAGIEFRNSLTEKQKELLAFIDSHKKNKDARTKGIRFSIHAPKKAVIKTPYLVKRIARNGMLIESDESYNIGDEFQIEMDVPETGEITFTGRVASCTEITGKEPMHYNIGVEFVELDDDALSIISAHFGTIFET